MNKMTFDEFQQAMIKHAKEVQGKHYAGDAYYLDSHCNWRERYEEGESPEHAVESDMSHWLHTGGIA